MATPKKVVTPDVDLNPKAFEYDGQTFEVRSRFKMGKFFKALETNPVEALELILVPESYERFENLEMDMDGFREFMEAAANAVGGASAKN